MAIRYAPFEYNVAAGVNPGPSQVFTAVNYVDESNFEYFLEANEIYAP